MDIDLTGGELIDQVSVRPTKRYFIDMLTADISFEDALLDLIDNSVDAIASLHSLKLDVSLIKPATQSAEVGRIDLTICQDMVKIVDDGCGIRYDDAVNTVFRLGRKTPAEGHTLGVYGSNSHRVATVTSRH